VRWGGAELSQIPGIAAWRAAYKGFGIRQTRYRSRRAARQETCSQAARSRA